MTETAEFHRQVMLQALARAADESFKTRGPMEAALHIEASLAASGFHITRTQLMVDAREALHTAVQQINLYEGVRGLEEQAVLSRLQGRGR